MKKFLLAAIAACAVPLVSAAAAPAPAADPARMREDIRVLSSDAFEGRAPNSAGEQKTVAYLIEQLTKIGLEPGGDLKDGKRAWTQDVPLSRYEIVGTPTLSATVGDGPAAALLLIDRGPAGWTSRTLIKGLHWVDRLALGPTAQHLAFAWAGDPGGVAGLYWMELPNGAPQRLTNRAPYTPGQPPADFIPLPLGGAPVFDGPLLRWRSAEGEHQVELPQ